MLGKICVFLLILPGLLSSEEKLLCDNSVIKVNFRDKYKLTTSSSEYWFLTFNRF